MRERLTLVDCVDRGNLLLDCTKASGKEICFPEGSDTPIECAPVATPVTASLSTLMNAGQVPPLYPTPAQHPCPFYPELPVSLGCPASLPRFNREASAEGAIVGEKGQLLTR